jgi:hypothetical protein
MLPLHVLKMQRWVPGHPAAGQDRHSRIAFCSQNASPSMLTWQKQLPLPHG